MNPSLLNQILDLMKDGRVHSKDSLGSALGTSAAMVDMMIEHLIRMGYVERIGGESARDPCSLCDQNRGSRTQCTLCHQQGRALLLTRKGIQQAATTEAGPGTQA